MARVFITGSADGLGQLAAKQLVREGHQVVLHARNRERGKEAMETIPGAEAVLTADLSNLEETIQLAKDVNELGSFQTVIHNAGVYRGTSDVMVTVNTLAPYVLTCLIGKPARLIYLSSGMHLGGQAKLKELASDYQRITYSDSKLQVTMLTMAVARLWSSIYANAVDPGWVPTKMGGASAPDNLEKGYQTQTWLATSDDVKAKVSGRYFFHQRQRPFALEANDTDKQLELLTICEQITGVRFPNH